LRRRQGQFEMLTMTFCGRDAEEPVDPALHDGGRRRVEG
jgi:hypothetical protein